MSRYLESITMANKISIIKNAIDDNKDYVELCGKQFNIGHSFGEKTIISNCLLFCNKDLNILASLDKNEIENYKKELEYLLSLTKNRLEEVKMPIEKIYISIDESNEKNLNYLSILVKKTIIYSDSYNDEYTYDSILENIKIPNIPENYNEIENITNRLKEKYNII